MNISRTTTTLITKVPALEIGISSLPKTPTVLILRNPSVHAIQKITASSTAKHHRKCYQLEFQPRLLNKGKLMFLLLLLSSRKASVLLLRR